jgi:hypothetical protein
MNALLNCISHWRKHPLVPVIFRYADLPPLTPPKIGGEPIQNTAWLLAPLLDKEGLGVVASVRQAHEGWQR